MAVFQSLILLACNLVFHRIFENQGMIISAIVCNLIVFIVYFLYVNYKYNFFEITSTIKRLEIKKYFYDYIEFPKIVLWSEFLLIFIQQAPNALIAPIYSKSSVGFFSLVFRVLRIPTMVIGNAVGAVFMNEAIDQYRGKSEFSGLFKKSLKMLGIMGFIFFLFVGLFSPWVFEFVLGPNWGQAGKMAQLMSPLFFLDFISWPLMSIYIITKSFKLGLLVRLLTAISIPITIYAGYFFYKDIYKSILFFQISLIIFTILHIVLTYYLSKGKKIFFDNN
jgi:O-antigen/teichoic acid export membrane protein